MKPEIDITVVMTTYNNAEDLRRTLEGFASVDRVGLEIELVVVDNNSTDATKSIIETYSERLPVRYLHEARKGKCAAQNRALNTAVLGQIVFFTDDDVDVPANLFREILACAERHPAHGVFGGAVHLIWPRVKIPAWAKALAESFRAYSHLDLGPQESQFSPGRTPVGTNWWVRREVIEKGYRFDERIGPGSKRCSMGDETAFLLQLARDGHPIIYAPAVRVGHRVARRLLTEKEIMRQGLSAGRAGALLAYEYGFGPARSIQNDLGWSVLRTACLVRWMLHYAFAFLSLRKAHCMIRRWDAMQGVGWNLEALRIPCDEGPLRTRGAGTVATPTGRSPDACVNSAPSLSRVALAPGPPAPGGQWPERQPPENHLK